MPGALGRPAQAAVAALLILALATSALAFSREKATGHLGGALAVSAEGPPRIFDSHRQGAILSVSALAPGRSARGRVSIANLGAPGRLTLSAHRLASLAGAGGGLLVDALRLRIRELTDGAGSVVYAGRLAAMRPQRLGRLGRSKKRRYRFVVTLPRGVGDAFAGSALRIDYRWKLTAAP